MKLCLVVAAVLVGLAVVNAGRDHRERKGGNGKVLVHVAKKLAPGLANKIPGRRMHKPKGYKPKRHGRRRRRRRCGRRNLWRIARRIALGLSGGRRRVGICDSLDGKALNYYCKHSSERKGGLNNLIESAERKVQFLTETTPAACAVTADDEPTPSPDAQAILDQIAAKETEREETAARFEQYIEVATNGSCEETLFDGDGSATDLQSLNCTFVTLVDQIAPGQNRNYTNSDNETVTCMNPVDEPPECVAFRREAAVQVVLIDVIPAGFAPEYNRTLDFIPTLETARDEALAEIDDEIDDLKGTLPEDEPPTCDCEKSKFELRKEFRCVRITNFRNLHKESLSVLIGKAQDDIACIDARCDVDAPADGENDDDDDENDDDDDE